MLGGKREVRAWLRRSFAVRGPRRLYVFAILIVVGLNVLAMAIALVLGVPFPTGDELRAWPEIVIVFPLYVLLVGTTEESGWRGFAMPRLTALHGPMKATLILAVIIPAWHLPLVFSGAQAGPTLLAAGASQFLYTWLQGKTNGSVPIVMVAHAAQGGIAGAYFGPMLSGADEALELAVVAGLYSIVALGIVLVTRRRARARAEAPAAVASY